MNISGIYQIKSQIKPDRCYVGSAVNIAQRWRNHLSQLKRGKHHSCKLQGHFDKYGINDLVFSVLEECANIDLLEREQCYINNINPSFNICKIAGNSCGVAHSKESRKRQSEYMKGRYSQSNEVRIKISISLTGYKRPKDEIIHLKNNKHGCKINLEMHNYIISNIKTMTQADLARELNIHQSTISKHLKN